MTKRLVMYAAIDHLAQLEQKQRQTFTANVQKFLNANPITEPNELRSSYAAYRATRERPFKLRLEHFREVRSSFAAAIKHVIAKPSPSAEIGDLVEQINEIEPDIFEAIACFEAATLQYKESSDLLIDDSYYNQSLNLLSTLGQIATSGVREPSSLVSAINAITEYYKEMDHILADKFNRTHHRSSDMSRIGPFSISTGIQWLPVTRPAIILSSDQLKDFREILCRHFNCYQRQRTNESWLAQRLTDKPSAFSFMRD
jgi:hypothetical protein